MILRWPMALARKCLAARLGHYAWTGRAGISEVENTRTIRMQVRQVSDCAVVELYSLKWQ